jgi:membrane fusion protein, heavy metal efflux system
MIHTDSRRQPPTPNTPRIVRPRNIAWVIVAALVLVPAALQGCKKKDAHAEGDGHDHSKPTANAGHPEGDGHDHGGGGGEEAHADEVKLTADAIERYGVKVEPAQLWQLRPTFTAPARVAFNTEAMAHVGSPLRGRAIEIKVKRGSMVKAGDELIVVESPELGAAQSDLLLKKTAVQTAQPVVDLAKTAWDRAKGLYEKSEGIALTEVQRREAEYKAAVAAQRSAEASATAAENLLHLLGMKQAEIETVKSSGEVNPRLTINASIAGQVVEREVTLGELVSPDRESLLVIADTSVLWVLADVPEARIHELAVGAKAWVKVGSIDAPRYEGSIAFISPMVDAATRTAQVRIEVQGGEVEIVATNPSAADPTPVIAVPEQAVQTVEGGPAVFLPVSGEDNTFAKRAVTIGKPVGGLIPIFSGLVEGEQFVAAGSFILKAELGKAGAAHEH